MMPLACQCYNHHNKQTADDVLGSRACEAICACAGEIQKTIRARGVIETHRAARRCDAVVDFVLTEVPFVAVNTRAPATWRYQTTV